MARILGSLRYSLDILRTLCLGIDRRAAQSRKKWSRASKAEGIRQGDDAACKAKPKNHQLEVKDEGDIVPANSCPSSGMIIHLAASDCSYRCRNG
jgi:hypothetical protein